MLIRITGLLQDGSTPRPGSPPDGTNPISVQQGETTLIQLDITTPNGAAYIPTEFDTLTLTMRGKPQDDWNRVLINADSSNTFTITPRMTKYTPAGQYAYDVWLTKQDGSRYAVVPTSTFQVLPSVAAVLTTSPPQVLEFVSGDTDPLVLDFSGTDISTWSVLVRIGYAVPLSRSATPTDPTHGITEVQWQPTDLVAGRWLAEVEVTKPGPTVKTTDVFVMEIRAHI